MLATLDASLTALGPCSNPANWVESEMAAGPAVPFEADLTAPRLSITANIGAQNGSFRVHPMLAQLHAGIALRAGPAGVLLGPLLQNYVLGQVNQRLNQAVIDMDLGGVLQLSLEQLRTGLLGSGTLLRSITR